MRESLIFFSKGLEMYMEKIIKELKKIKYICLKIDEIKPEEAKEALDKVGGNYRKALRMLIRDGRNIKRLESLENITPNLNEGKSASREKIYYICRRTGVTEEEAERFLKENNNDEIEAVMMIKKKKRRKRGGSKEVIQKKVIEREESKETKIKEPPSAPEFKESSNISWEKTKKIFSLIKRIKTEVDKVKNKAVNICDVTAIDPFSLEGGKNLICLIDPEKGAILVERMITIRRHIAHELGLILPPVRFKSNLDLEPDKYIIKIRNIKVAEAIVRPGRFLAIGPYAYIQSIKGEQCYDPTYRMPSVWITADQRGNAERAECMIFDPVSVIATHITEIIRCNASDFLGREDVKVLLDKFGEKHPLLVKEVYPELFALREIQQILQHLVKERVSIRDLSTILETLGDYGHITKDTEKLIEYVRRSLSPLICSDYKDERGVINVIELDPEVENIISDAVVKTDYGSFLTLAPYMGVKILTALGEELQKVMDKGLLPVVLCSSSVRLYLRRLTERPFPNAVILSYNEITPEVKINSLGMVALVDKKRDTKRGAFYYIEKMLQDEKPFIRWEGIKLLLPVANEHNKKEVFAYLDKGLEDEDETVRYETARVIRELCSKKISKYLC